MMKYIKEFKLWLLKRQLKKYFKSLKWSNDNIWDMTSGCGSLNDAINHLCYRLLEGFGNEDNRLWKTAKKLISDGYENEWKY